MKGRQLQGRNEGIVRLLVGVSSKTEIEILLMHTVMCGAWLDQR